MAATGAVNSGKNSFRMEAGISPGTESVFLDILIFWYITWSVISGWMHGSDAILVSTLKGKISCSNGVNSWLIFEKYFTKASADWMEEKLLSMWDGSENVPEMSSPGLALSTFAFFIQPVVLGACPTVVMSACPTVVMSAFCSEVLSACPTVVLSACPTGV